MTLLEYLRVTNQTVAAWAREHGKGRMTVHRHATGSRIPNKDEMAFYFRVTEGRVTPNDFYGLPGSGRNHAAHAGDDPAPGAVATSGTDVHVVQGAEMAA